VKSARLLIFGVAVISVASAIWLLLGWSMQFWPAGNVEQLRDTEWLPGPETIASEIAVYQSGWWAQMQRRLPDALEFQTLIFLIWGVWRAGGLMLVGMALYKLGVVSGQRSSRFYGSTSAIGFLIGLPLIVYGVQRDVLANWDVRYSFFVGSQWNYWGSLFLTAGWIGLVVLAAKSPAFGGITARLGAVGRMAFTNYLLQTIICTTIFYGHGLGFFGQVSRVGQMLVVLGVWIFRLAVSALWLRRFNFGPVEWLWRSLTYGHRQPFRRLLPVDEVTRSAG
jgi:uncharacterized protein